MPWQNEQTYELNDQQIWKAPTQPGVYGLLKPENLAFYRLYGKHSGVAARISQRQNALGYRTASLVFRFRGRPKTGMRGAVFPVER